MSAKFPRGGGGGANPFSAIRLNDLKRKEIFRKMLIVTEYAALRNKLIIESIGNGQMTHDGKTTNITRYKQPWLILVQNMDRP